MSDLRRKLACGWCGVCGRKIGTGWTAIRPEGTSEPGRRIFMRIPSCRGAKSRSERRNRLQKILSKRENCGVTAVTEDGTV